MSNDVTEEMIIDAVYDRLAEAVAREQFGDANSMRNAAIECFRLVDSFKHPVQSTTTSLQEWIEGK